LGVEHDVAIVAGRVREGRRRREKGEGEGRGRRGGRRGNQGLLEFDGAAEEEAKVDVHQVALRVEHDVAVVSGRVREGGGRREKGEVLPLCLGG
jgi:hypothetical protein